MFGWNKRGGSRRNSAFIKKLKMLGRPEQLVVHTRDVSSYAVGFEVPVIYFYEKGICLAAPASVL